MTIYKIDDTELPSEVIERFNRNTASWDLASIDELCNGDIIKMTVGENRYTHIESGNNVWIISGYPYFDERLNTWAVNTLFE